MNIFALIIEIFALVFGDGYLQPKTEAYKPDSAFAAAPDEGWYGVKSVKLSGADGADVKAGNNYSYWREEVYPLALVDVSAEEFDGARLTFYCEEDISLENPVVVWRDDRRVLREGVPEASPLGNSVSFEISKGGSYELWDKEQWHSSVYYKPKWDSQSLDFSAQSTCELTGVTVEGADYVTLDENGEWLHENVVGLVGKPVELTADEYEGAKITFRCDEQKLERVTPNQLIVLWYDEKAHFYREYTPTLNTADCTLSLEIDKGGVYMLADKIKWYKVWGKPIDENVEGKEFVYSSSRYTAPFEFTIPETTVVLNDDNPEKISSSPDGAYSMRLYESDPMYSEVAHSCTYTCEENAWQSECDNWAKMPYTADKFTTIETLDYTLEGAYAKFYLYTYDCATRGDEYICSIIMQVKVADNAFLAFSFSTDERMSDSERAEFVEKYAAQLKTFRWVDMPSDVVFTPEKPFDINQYPELLQSAEPITLVPFSYTDIEPNMTITLPSNISGQITNHTASTSMQQDYGISRGLFSSWGTQDIHVSADLCWDDNLWQNRAAINQYYTDIEGASETVEDISAEVGCEAEIHVLRYADTGKVESNHNFIYVIGLYKISENEVVSIFYDMWADTEGELPELAEESLKSVRFD